MKEPESTKAELVLIEDDEGDALLVRALLEEVGDERNLSWFTSVGAAAEALGAGPECVLLDLGLPDVSGDEAVRRVVAEAPEAAVVVLTGFADEARGVEAIASGAQDYLVKGTVDGHLLVRSLNYALERKRAAATARRLREAQLRAEENLRLERGLLPRPLLRSGRLRCVTHYRPGGEDALLGGDFFDVVELEDHTVHAVIGDVAGHGPDEAALGARLRVAWRTLVLAGIESPATLSDLQAVFVTERAEPWRFATLADVRITADLRTATITLAGHSAPLVIAGGRVVRPELGSGPPLGVVEDGAWVAKDVLLSPNWAILLFTDGLVENVVSTREGRRRMGDDGLESLVERQLAAGEDIESIVTETLARLGDEERSRRVDDVAIVALWPKGA